MLERWITPSLFKGTEAKDEYTLVSLGRSYRQAIERHYKTFITEQDIAWLAAQGVTHLRIPVGYWLFGGKEPFLPTVNYLDQLFAWAKKYQLQVLISVHAAPGSQNGKLHSGQIGPVSWQHYLGELTVFTDHLIARYAKQGSFDGLCVLNEPSQAPFNIRRLINYYRQIKQRHPNLNLYIDGTFFPRLWASIASKLNMGLDMHLYHGYGKTVGRAAAHRRLRRKKLLLDKVAQQLPVIVGEWSGMIHRQPDKLATQRYVKEQRQAYQAAQVEYYWTYKTEHGGTWSFRSSRKK